jgi:CopG family transcriptional regulator, nickel-responsive regulator
MTKSIKVHTRLRPATAPPVLLHCAAATEETAMQRVTITIDDELDAELDRYMRARGYDNRSEALRDLARAGLQQAALEVAGSRACVAALIYVYDHEARDLPKRLTHDFHERHDLAQATLHMHLDHDSCMEVTVLKGRGSDVQNFANRVIAERGVRHGHVVYLPADGMHDHSHGHAHSHSHAHNHSHAHDPGRRSRGGSPPKAKASRS